MSEFGLAVIGDGLEQVSRHPLNHDEVEPSRLGTCP
jgi:hypothetical protein